MSWMVPVPETLLNRLNGWRLSELPKQFQFKGDRLVLGCVQKATQICSLDAIQQPNVIYLCCVGHFEFYSNWIIQHNRRTVNEKHNYSGRMEIGLRVGNIRIQTQTQQKLPTERCCDAGQPENGATTIITDQQRKKERCWYPFNGNKMRRMLPCRISSAWNQMNYPGICSESLALLFDTKALRLFIECECLCAG